MKEIERDEQLIEHIIVHSKRILELVEKIGTFEEFSSNYVYQNSIFFDFLQIGENINRLSFDYKEKHPNIPYRLIVDFRNIVAHGYGTIRLNEVWKCALNDVPHLLDEFEKY